MKRARAMCLSCGEKPAKRLMVFREDLDPANFCTLRCAAREATQRVTSDIGSVSAWCRGCGWVTCETNDVFSDYHDDEVCPLGDGEFDQYPGRSKPPKQCWGEPHWSKLRSEG